MKSSPSDGSKRGVTSLRVLSAFEDDRSTDRIPGGYPAPEERSNGEDGQTTVVMALFLATFLFGFIAFGIDVGYMFHEKRMAQAAADAAAVAAGEESSTPPTGSFTASQHAAANAMATLNGFNTSAATNPATVTLTIPSGGNYSNSINYVQAVVSQPISTIFMKILHMPSMTISARSVAGVGQNSPTCVCLEGASGMDLNLSNNASYTPSGCGTTVNSTSSNAVGVVGSATLGGGSLGIVSTTWTEGSNVNNGGSITVPANKIVTGLSSSCGPALPAAPTYNSSKCTADPLTNYGNGGSSYSVGPGSQLQQHAGRDPGVLQLAHRRLKQRHRQSECRNLCDQWRRTAL